MMPLFSELRWVGASAEPLRHFGWTARKASGVRRPSFRTQFRTCVTLARYLGLSVLPFLIQQMAPVCSTLPNTQDSGKSRPKGRGDPPQEVSVEWEACPASTLGEDSPEGSPRPQGSLAAFFLIREIDPGLSGKSLISRPPPKP